MSSASFAKPILHDDNKTHVLLAASGSVATIKIPNIVKALSTYPQLSVRLVLTASAAQFLAGQSAEQPDLATIAAFPNVDGIYLDADEWSKPWVRGDKILHIELRRWADILVIAPLSANTMAKMTLGISDNLLLSTIRAWDTTGMVDAQRQTRSGASDENGILVPVKKRIIVAPAMNTAMWAQPITKQHVKILEEDWGINNDGWIEMLRPTEKELACGDTGSGAMTEWSGIVTVIEERLSLQK